MTTAGLSMWTLTLVTLCGLCASSVIFWYVKCVWMCLYECVCVFVSVNFGAIRSHDHLY